MDFRAGATTSLGVLVFVATIGAHDVHAQIRGVSVDAAYRQTWTDNTPLGHPAGVALTLRRAGTGIAVWIEAERLSAITHRHGSTCVGLIFPDEPCDPEPLEDRARLSGGALGLGGAVHRSRWLTVDLIGALRGAHVSADTRGSSSGEQISASRMLWGLEGGLDVLIAPWPTWPLVVALSGRVRGLIPVVGYAVVDGYEPFGAIGVRSLQLGLRWRARSALP